MPEPQRKYTALVELLDDAGQVIEPWRFSGVRSADRPFASARVTFTEEGDPSARVFGPELLLEGGTAQEPPASSVPAPGPEITYTVASPSRVECAVRVVDLMGAEIPADIVATIMGGTFADGSAGSMTLPSPAVFAWLPDVGVDCRITFHADAGDVDITGVSESVPPIDPGPVESLPQILIHSKRIRDDKYDVWAEALPGVDVLLEVVSGGRWHTGRTAETRAADAVTGLTGHLALLFDDPAIVAVVHASAAGMLTRAETIGG